MDSAYFKDVSRLYGKEIRLKPSNLEMEMKLYLFLLVTKMTKAGKRISLIWIVIVTITPVGFHWVFFPALIFYWLPSRKRKKVLSFIFKPD